MKKSCLFLLIMATLFSCQKEEPLVVSPTSINLYSGISTQITTNSQNVTYKSADEFYASVSASGLVTANKVGNTRIMVEAENGKVDIPVNVMPAYDLYPDMDYYIGKSINELTNILGNPASTNNNVYTYTDITKYVAAVGADVINGIISNIIVVVPTKYTSMLADYLLERYTPAATLNDTYFFLNHMKDIAILLEVQNISYMSVFYTKRENSNAQKMSAKNCYTLIENAISSKME